MAFMPTGTALSSARNVEVWWSPEAPPATMRVDMRTALVLPTRGQEHGPGPVHPLPGHR